jgi:deoxyadenosine/deoxycytidine kinase
MLISFEGAIGAGKSTLLAKLERVAFAKKHVVLYEPVDEWMNVCPDGTTSLFEKYYSDKKRYGFMFQIYALQTRLAHLMNVIKNHPDDIILCERTHLSDCEIFAKMLTDNGTMDPSEAFVYKCWSDQTKSMLQNIVKGVVYLKATPETCLGRIRNRNRDGEDGINVEYVHKLCDLHDEWLADIDDFDVCTVDVNTDQDSIDIDSIIAFINQICIKK